MTSAGWLATVQAVQPMEQLAMANQVIYYSQAQALCFRTTRNIYIWLHSIQHPAR
jgi:hypothetical protein